MKKHLLPAKIIIAVLLFLVLKCVVSFVALSSFAKVSIDAAFDHDDSIEIYFSSGLGKDEFRKDYRRLTTPYMAGKRNVTTTDLDNHIARKVRIDLGRHPGTVKLYAITFRSHYGPPIFFDHRQIARSFTPNDQISSIRPGQDCLTIETSGEDPFLVYQQDLIADNLLVGTILPIIVSVLTVLFVFRFHPASIPAWADIHTKRSSSGINYGALDGIRGLAAFLVLGQHTRILTTSGSFGVWLFFCLSGFLLATPFVHQPGRAASFSYMSNYIIRRIKRITPMYYTMITVTILFSGKFDTAIRHYLFLQADGHYWTVSQEMFFYLLLPLVMVVPHLFCKKKLLPAVVFMAVAAAAVHQLLTVDILPLHGNGRPLKPMAGIFFIGILSAFVYQWLRNEYPTRCVTKTAQYGCSIIGGTILVGSIVCAEQLIGPLSFLDASAQTGGFGMAAGATILFVLLSGNTFFNQLMNLLPLRAVGLVGFSFYLLHPMMISCVEGTCRYFFNFVLPGPALFVTVGIATYLLSTLTYSYIERPFIMSVEPHTTTLPIRKATEPTGRPL